MDLGIKGKKAIINGGSAGMGKGSAIALAREGVDLVIETTGTPVGWYHGQDIVKEHGQVTMVGGQERHALKKTCLENFTLTAGVGHGYSTATIMKRVMQGDLNPGMLISHRMNMAEIERAFHMIKYPEHYGVRKILILNDIL